MAKDYDVIIVGAGPAGIFTALELFKQDSNLKVLLVDSGKGIKERNCPARKLGYLVRRCAAKECEARILAERIVHIAQHHRAVFRAHVPYGAAHKADVIPARFVCNFRHAGVVAAVHGVRRTKADAALKLMTAPVEGFCTLFAPSAYTV